VSEQGTRVECQRCGRVEIDPDINFCPACGSPLRGEPARLKLRRRLSGLFVFLTVLSLVVTVVGAWARAVALDTDRFVATVGPVIDDPAVQQALSIRLTDRVMEGLQVEDRVSTALASLDQGELPVSPALLAAPITDGIRTVLLKRTEQAISSDAFQNLWNTALTRAHSQAIALLRGESTNATIEDDAVYINLLPFINDALASLEGQLSEIFNRSIDVPTITEDNVGQAVGLLEQQFGVDLPEDFGQIKVFESDALPAAQAAIATMDKVVYALVALTILLAIVAFALSTRRLRTALWLGFGAAIGLIVIRRLALRLDDAIVARVTGETNQAAVGAVTNDVFQDLRNFTTLMLVAAILIGVGAYLAGRPPWLTRTLERASDGTLVARDAGWVRWIGEHALVLRVVAVVLGALILFFADLGWLSLLVVMALVAATWFVLTYLYDRVTGQADVATG
jgi:ribosomal protein L37E